MVPREGDLQVLLSLGAIALGQRPAGGYSSPQTVLSPCLVSAGIHDVC